MTSSRWLALLSFSLVSCAAERAPRSGDEAWVSLFNGRDLAGWEVKFAGHPVGRNYLDTFRVEDGVLVVSYDGYERFDGEFGHLITRDAYASYVLRVEYRFVGEQTTGGPDWALRNSGVMVHSQSAASMGVDQEFPVSIEVQLLGGSGAGDRPTANLCTPGTHVVIGGELVAEHCVESSSGTYHGDDWVTVEVEVRGGRLIRHRIDGRNVLEYSEPQLGGEYLPSDYPLAEGTRLVEGHIALQAESHPVEFRRVELMKLAE